MENLIYYIAGAGIFGLAFSFWRKNWVKTQELGSTKTDNYVNKLTEAAKTFIISEYKVLGIFVASLSILLFFKAKTDINSNSYLALSFITGAALSALASYLGLKFAIKSNKKTVEAAQSSLNQAFSVAFSAGIYNGLTTVSLSVIGLSALLFSYSYIGINWGLTNILNIILGFALGSSTVAIFSKIGGGTYANAAKESYMLLNEDNNGLKENSNLNPAKIGQELAYNVSEVSGSSANIFDSYTTTIIAAMIIGSSFVSQEVFSANYSLSTVLLPLVLAAVGIISSIMGAFMVKSAEENNFFSGFKFGEYFSTAIFIISSFFIIKYFLPIEWNISENIGDELIITKYKSLGVFWAAFMGVGSGIIIELISEYYTKTYKNPTNTVVKSSFLGAWANVTKGIEKGMLSTVYISLVIIASIYVAYLFAGYYGIAISAVALLANSGFQVALNTFFAISESSDNIAQQTDIEYNIKDNTKKLKDLGNNQLPISKSFSILAAILTTLSVLVIFSQQTDFSLNEYNSVNVLISLFAGIMIPFLFSSIIIGSVERIKTKMLTEANRQFTDIPQLNESLEIIKKYDGDLSFANEEEKAIVDSAEDKIEHKQFVEISTYYSVLEAIIIGVSAIIIPITVGYLFGAGILAGMLIGVSFSSIILAFFQSNSAGTWNSAEKMIYDGVQWNSAIYEKGSEAHKTSLVGALVGNTFRNATSPAYTVIIKVMALTALIIASGI
ncbi:MAG: sodium/proton-translocating pyrophosphatase [Bacteroidales bacterium]|nr:sodium/proton-translocating pyrophosphatase [Bacteroidales bacterium]MBN2756545.1 sodium/proton-translocating pyrophosphatase [Bacteroidales bacterium]